MLPSHPPLEDGAGVFSPCQVVWLWRTLVLLLEGRQAAEAEVRLKAVPAAGLAACRCWREPHYLAAAIRTRCA